MEDELNIILENIIFGPDAIDDAADDAAAVIDEIVIRLFRTVRSYDLLEYIVLCGKYDIRRPNEEGVTPAHVICGGDYTDTLSQRLVRLFAEQDISFDVVDAFGRTPLILAIETEKFSTTEELLVQGASPKKLMGSLISPLMLSIKMSLNDIAVLLVRLGADINEISNGETPLSLAIDVRNEYLQGFFEGKGAICPEYDSSNESVDPETVENSWYQ